MVATNWFKVELLNCLYPGMLKESRSSEPETIYGEAGGTARLEKEI